MVFDMAPRSSFINRHGTSIRANCMFDLRVCGSTEKKKSEDATINNLTFQFLEIQLPDHISCNDHQKEQDETRTCVTQVVWTISSNKMLAQALQQNVEAPKKELVKRKKENHHYVLY